MSTAIAWCVLALILTVPVAILIDRWIKRARTGPIEPPEWCTSAAAMEWGEADEIAYREACKRGKTNG